VSYEQKSRSTFLPNGHTLSQVGETRFELATSASRTQRSSQAELLPERVKQLLYPDYQKKQQDKPAKNFNNENANLKATRYDL
jgi:hypothetical protein